jgi:hypothetical protein
LLRFEPSERAKLHATNTMVAIARDVLPPDEVAAIDRMDDDEAERALADEIRKLKARDDDAYETLLAALPAVSRAYFERVARRYSL